MAMSGGDHILHFTIGPVQGFIEQARRTRDFWAGSFLLAWLSAIAMQKVADHPGAEIVFPKIEGDKMIAALRGVSAERPAIGTLPNRFKARVPAGFDPEQVADAVRGAWAALAATVWRRFVARVAARGNNTRGIWERQIAGFWEIAWIMDDDPRDGSDGDWLDLRKNWRSHRPPTEAGDHCTIMGEWQELSGHVQYRGAEAQREFWNAMREQTVPDLSRRLISDLDLQEGERLCAIALVRRLFPLLRPHDWRAVRMWRLPRRWPSTGHVAAAHWIADAWKKDQTACSSYAALVAQLGDRWAKAERTGPTFRESLRCLHDTGSFAWIDANLFFRDNIRNKYATPLGPYEHRRNDLLRGHAELTKRVGGEPRPFYALLRMDGDHVGPWLRRLDAAIVGDALAAFSEEAQSIVRGGDGIVVYAGGDDLLALLPLDTAICVAMRLERAYREGFAKRLPANEELPTTSASIVIADHHEPLRGVLRASQRLLEDVAKDENDRDSLAIELLKPSGSAATWVQSWHEAETGRSIPEALLELTERISKTSDISARFSYTLDRRFLATLGKRFPELGLKPEELRDLLAVTLGKRRDDDAARARNIDALVAALLLIGTPHRGGKQQDPPAGAKFSVDGMRLAFFLAGRDGTEQREAAA
jgi:CRISPR-associated protein Cmr2